MLSFFSAINAEKQLSMKGELYDWEHNGFSH